jgi:hypothetical protein
LVISDGETRVEGEALVLGGDIDLLLGKDLLEKLGTRLKIDALPEIFIGERPIGERTSIGSNGPLTGVRNVETAREEIRTSLEQVQERQKELYAKHMAAVGFNPGEEVGETGVRRYGFRLPPISQTNHSISLKFFFNVFLIVMYPLYYLYNLIMNHFPIKDL